MSYVFERFAEYLRNRLEAGSFTTEDSIRYTLFYALAETLDLKDIVVESPHPAIPGARIDLVAPTGSDGSLLAMEFKYDRRGKLNSPMPMKAGALVHDFVRIAILPEQYRSRYVVYVTDDEMHGYFERSALRTKMGFYGAISGAESLINAALLAEQSATLRGRANLSSSVSVRIVHAARLPANHNLRVFSVLPSTVSES